MRIYINETQTFETKYQIAPQLDYPGGTRLSLYVYDKPEEYLASAYCEDETLALAQNIFSGNNSREDVCRDIQNRMSAWLKMWVQAPGKLGTSTILFQADPEERFNFQAIILAPVNSERTEFWVFVVEHNELDETFPTYIIGPTLPIEQKEATRNLLIREMRRETLYHLNSRLPK